ncbi:major royal jelly protein [Zymoseptoria brevis]|uniref:Major royal jelly protein n=1 Tax=Zymoseptoria brevis TaxID=1047168 RepID=A0A0F4GKA0_9PEZI|nr:major royal jelly protein [Zymoseptoria brevis]
MTSLQALALLGLAVVHQSTAQSVRTDPGVAGPSLEVVHLFTGQWPTGIAVSASGRKFSCFPAGLDINNAYNGLIPKFQVAELISMNTETAYPNSSYNQSPGGAVNRLSLPPATKGDANHLLGVQSVIIDSKDTLWILDTGRVQDLSNPVNPILPATIPGGPKLVNIDLTTDTIIQTIVLQSDSVKPFSYLNDLRIDRNPNLSGSSGKGVAYLTDSSPEGENALVFVDLGTGKGQRYPLKETFPIPKTLPWVWGDPMYQTAGAVAALDPSYITFGSDGIAISSDYNTLYFSVIGGRFLYSLPTSALRGNNSVDNAQSLVKNLGEKGISDGLESDSNGIVYNGNVEQNGISMYNPLTGFATTFVRDPRINWVDTMSIAKDGYLYFTVNQLNYLDAIYPGQGLPLVDRRKPPYVVFRAKLPNGGNKIR